MPILNFQQSGTGQPVVLIHGLFGSLENLNMVAKGLNDHYGVVNLDVRNHGSSFHQNSMSYAELAQDVIDTLDHLHIPSATLIGHSMGGKIAMQIALDFPQRVNKLIVADIAPVEYPPHHNKIIEGLQLINSNTINNRQHADKTLSNYVEEVGVRQFLLRNLKKVDDRWVFKCHVDFIAQCYSQIVEGYHGNRQFDKATLFVKGGLSDYITQDHQAIIRHLFPNSKAKIIQGAGHWLHAEKTTAFNKIVKDFIEQT